MSSPSAHFLRLRKSIPSAFRMLSLSLLGLGPAAVSPGLLLLLVGASWLLAGVLTWSHSLYETRRRLWCFPQPPKLHWFWGHLGMVKNNEEYLRQLEDLGPHFRDVHLWWMGPFTFLRFVHPKFVVPLLQAPGISPTSTHPATHLPPPPDRCTHGQTRLSREMGSID
uniref:Uncharacterized protein n=1 Tax=Suricata suricatta TaxID=37032 RepID=A0A673T4T7_SURSU